MPSKENRVLLKEISNCNSVCVHIRRGDYLDPRWSYLNVCTENYYIKAIEYVKEKIDCPIFYIFSNTHEDVLWIKKNYNLAGINVKFVDLNNPDYEELRLMYHCKNFIISNSTFSWWAQYLCQNDSKMVVAPSQWNNQANSENIYMDNWHIIEV